MKFITTILLLIGSVLALAQPSFGPPTRIAVRTSQLAVGDVDGDGAVDIIIAGSNQVWYAGPAFTTAYTLGTSDGGPYAARMADVDGDGDLDFVTSNGARTSGSTGRMYVYYNPGGTAAQTQSNWTRVEIYTGSARHLNDMVIHDVDGDGKLDVVAKSWENAERLVIAFQDTPTSWTARSIATGETGSMTEGLAVGDLDGDGTAEIVNSGFYSKSANWRTGPYTDYTFATRFLNEEMKAGIADFDGDGDADIYMASAEGNTFVGAYWYENTGTAGGGVTYAERAIDASAGKLHMHDVLDFDGDGDIDVVAAQSFGADGIYLYDNDGSGNFAILTISSTTGFYTGVAADPDGDGDKDLAGPREFYNSTGVNYLINNGPLSPPDAPTGATATLAANGADISVTWVDNSSDEATFELEREAAGGSWLSLVPLPQNTTAYTDATAAAGTTYRYRVRASNGGGGSAYSTSATVTTWAQAGAVSITPAGGNYSNPPTITLTQAAPANTIRYTLDGSAPTESSTAYAQPFVLNASATVRAAGFGGSLQASTEASKTYNVATNGNFAPEANAGPDQTVNSLDPVILDATASSDLDDANSQLSFTWTQLSGPAVTITDANQATASFTPPSFGVYEFRVTVTDPAGAGDFDDVTVTVDPLDPSLVAYWKLDDAAGLTATDETTNGHDGTLVSGPTWSTDAVAGGSLSFDGSNDRVDIPAFDVAGSALTMSCWIKSATLSTAEGRFISKAFGTSPLQHYWMLSQIGQTGIRVRIQSANNIADISSPTGLLSVDTWHFVAATYDGSDVRLYLDGTQVAGTPLTGALLTDPSIAVALGDQPPGGSRRLFEGLLDEVKVYNRALTPQELADEYAAGQPPLAGDVLGFGASRIDETSARVFWSSVDERDITGYAVERTGDIGDGKTVEIAWLSVQPTTTHRVDYSYVDASPESPVGYYRYRRFFEDGRVETSDWAAVDMRTAGTLSASLRVWPNPTGGQLSLKPVGYARAIVVVDATGRTVREVILPAGDGEMDLTGLPAGVYRLRDAAGESGVSVVVR